MSSISLLIKPSSSSCNMACKYCFYEDETKNRRVKNYGMMSSKTATAIIESVFSNEYTMVTFAFQGGEPTLAGITFYKHFVKTVNANNVRGVVVNYSIQTNGYTLTAEWADFFAKNNFLVGLSIDGTKEIHNQHRCDCKGNDTYKRIMQSVHQLKEYKVEFNVLSVVTKSFARHIDSIWKYYVEQGFSYLQFIPCLDPIGEERGQEKYSLAPKVYGEFLKKSFDLWYAALVRGNYVYVRFFDELMFLATGRQAPSCTMCGKCSNQLVIEADGSVYPCDFYALDEYLIGNILTDSIKELKMKGDTSEFVTHSYALPSNCKDCRWFNLGWCRGGCRRDHENGNNYYCTSFQTFFEYAEKRIRILAKYMNSQAR